jgi:nitroreductase
MTNHLEHSPISESALEQLFVQARTFSSWLPQDVSNDTLQKIYDLMKWGPTSANTCPMRIIFVKSAPEKEKLVSVVDDFNRVKVKEAPVTAIIALDSRFFEQIPKLFPHAPEYKDFFASHPDVSATTAFRNSSLQGAYFIIATRAMGLDCGPMSGFNNQKLDEVFLGGTSWKSNFICNIGYGNRAKLHPRGPRLSFAEACRVI